MKPLAYDSCPLCAQRIEPKHGRMTCCGISSPIPRKLRSPIKKTAKKKSLTLDEKVKDLEDLFSNYSTYQMWVPPRQVVESERRVGWYYNSTLGTWNREPSDE